MVFDSTARCFPVPPIQLTDSQIQRSFATELARSQICIAYCSLPFNCFSCLILDRQVGIKGSWLFCSYSSDQYSVSTVASAQLVPESCAKMCTHLSQLRARAALSLVEGQAAMCCPFARTMCSNGPWASQQKSHGFHTAVAAAKRSTEGCRSLNWLALVRNRLHQDSTCADFPTRQAPVSEHLPSRSFAVSSPFLPVLRPAMRHAQTIANTTLSPSSSGDSLASRDESTDGSTPVAASASAEAADEWTLEYTGSLSSTIRTLKVCFLSHMDPAMPPMCQRL